MIDDRFLEWLWLQARDLQALQLPTRDLVVAEGVLGRLRSRGVEVRFLTSGAIVDIPRAWVTWAWEFGAWIGDDEDLDCDTFLGAWTVAMEGLRTSRPSPQTLHLITIALERGGRRWMEDLERVDREGRLYPALQQRLPRLLTPQLTRNLL